jgi:hypothetical protein
MAARKSYANSEIGWRHARLVAKVLKRWACAVTAERCEQDANRRSIWQGPQGNGVLRTFNRDKSPVTV